MIRRSRCVLACLLLAAPLLSSCAASRAQKEESAEGGHAAQVRAALLRAGDADSLAAAAFLDGGQPADGPQRLMLLTQAVARAPNRLDLRWLQAQVCASLEVCDARPAIDALVDLDPDNAAPRLLRIREPDDEAALRADLQAMAEAKRFDFYWTRTVAHLTRPLIATGQYRPGPALVSVVAGLTSQAIPPFTPLTRACAASAVKDAARLATCRRIATVMRHGDTFLVEGLGLNLAKRLWPADSAEWSEANSARRVLQYRSQAFADVSAGHLSSAATLDDLRLYERAPSEQAVTLALLERAHRDAQPPAGWQSATPAG